VNRKTPMMPGDDVRETPPDKFAALDAAVGGFTLDVCATQKNTKCAKFFDESIDGLLQSWAGETCWCNPPFSDIGSWVDKAWRSPDAHAVVMVVPATRTEQSWWQMLVEPFRDGKIGRHPHVDWRLTTQFESGRWHFLKDGKPILDPKTGRRSSPKFGICLLVWSHDAR
jgi:phage N-6-adenine-methyltransferase